jgi:hypothetical protein
METSEIQALLAEVAKQASVKQSTEQGTEYASFGRVQVGSDGVQRVSALTLIPSMLSVHCNRIAEAAQNGPDSPPVELFPGFLVGYSKWRSKPKAKK